MLSAYYEEDVGGDDDEKWFPSPPKVDKPRSVFNAASLAYIGDSIYEVRLSSNSTYEFVLR